MGQTLNKVGGSEGKKKDIEPVLEKCYQTYFAESDPNSEDWTSAKFYHAVCQTIEEINKVMDSTQLCVPNTATLEKAYNKHHNGKGKSLTKEEFQRILQDVIIDTRVTGMGIKDIFLFIFGIPIAAVFIKQQTIPKVIPNDIFIPGVTSATVFLLAKLNKI